MEYNTSELCDIYPDQIDVLEPIFTPYGDKPSFSGQISTVKCFEDNSLINEMLSQPGHGKVLIIDGGGSVRRALIDAQMAQIASENQWEGVVVYGAIREIDFIDRLDIAIHALASIPVGADTKQIGEINVPVNFAGVTFFPDDFIYADSTGIILSQESLDELEAFNEEFDDIEDEDLEDEDLEDEDLEDEAYETDEEEENNPR